MTSIVTEATIQFVSDHSFTERSTSVGLLVVLLLVILLVVHQFLSAAARPEARSRLVVLDIAIIPLFIGFTFIVAVTVLGYVVPEITR